MTTKTRIQVIVTRVWHWFSCCSGHALKQTNIRMQTITTTANVTTAEEPQRIKPTVGNTARTMPLDF